MAWGEALSGESGSPHPFPYRSAISSCLATSTSCMHMAGQGPRRGCAPGPGSCHPRKAAGSAEAGERGRTGMLRGLHACLVSAPSPGLWSQQSRGEFKCFWLIGVVQGRALGGELYPSIPEVSVSPRHRDAPPGGSSPPFSTSLGDLRTGEMCYGEMWSFKVMLIQNLV